MASKDCFSLLDLGFCLQTVILYQGHIHLYIQMIMLVSYLASFSIRIKEFLKINLFQELVGEHGSQVV